MPLENNIRLVGTCPLNCVGMKGRLTCQPALGLLLSFSSLGDKPRAVASRSSAALQGSIMLNHRKAGTGEVRIQCLVTVGSG